MSEIIFIIQEAPEGGYTARALGHSIFTEGDTLAQIEENIREALVCHFDDESERPKMIRLHYVREQVVAV